MYGFYTFMSQYQCFNSMSSVFQQIKCNAFLFVLVGLFLQSSALAGTPSQKTVNVPTGSDTLVLQHYKKGKEIKVAPGTPLKIWLPEKQVSGNLESVTESSVIINNEYGQQEIPKAEIEQLKVKTTKPVARIFGALFLSFAAFFGFFTGLSLLVGLIGIITETIGIILLVAVPFLFVLSFGSFLIGRRLHGRKFKLKKRWSIAL